MSFSPRTLYATVALAETITWALLLLSMALKYGGVTAAVTPIAGGVHGFVFLSFCVATVVVWVNNQWPAREGVLGLASAVIPFATIPYERRADRAGRLDQGWRFGPTDSSQPRNVPEKVVAFIVRRPWPAVGVAFLGVAIVFGLLLALGSPLDAVRR